MRISYWSSDVCSSDLAVDAQPCQLHRRCEFSGLLLAFRANRGDAENRVRFRETGRWLEAVAIRAHGWRWWRWREMRSKAVAHAGSARHARTRATGVEQPEERQNVGWGTSVSVR